MASVLEVQDLVTEYITAAGAVRAVDRVSFEVGAGEIFGIVGESGSGKSATCRSVSQLFGGASVRIASGSVRVNGKELIGADPDAVRQVRRDEIAMVFQDPGAALNPTMRIGRQIGEAVDPEGALPLAEVRNRSVALMEAVRIPNAAERYRAWPHELSGGLRQRVVIAMALARNPSLILADEPTTALDVTVQDQILGLLHDARDARGAAVVLVTHDLGVVAETCDRMAVMYAGQIVETGFVTDVLTAPAHPYTRALIDALPDRQRDVRLRVIDGAPPSLLDPPSGCRFLPRCPLGGPECASARPFLRPLGDGGLHRHACVKGRVA